MANRLADSTSPYLLQHKDNPVEWWPWSDEAFAAARARGVPVLLSVGYAACHWCHVMAHESFEDEAIAALMNANFVCVKVDREERPDVDAVYMDAVTAMTGQGGWPMTAFLTPDGEPFYAGTYFPPAPRHGMPGFPELLVAVATAWRERRGEVEENARHVARQLVAQTDRPAAAGGPPGGDVLDEAARALASSYDATHGGFGTRPKFPPSMVLEFLLRQHARTGDQQALRMVEQTAERMARGGMYDQLGGGFARYSVDERWLVPHFEKMLYDNALLLGVYLHLWRATGSPLAARVAGETAQWMVRDLRTPEGGFASSYDADSADEHGHPHEGAFYAWTPAQLTDVLGADDGGYAAELYAVTAAGTFERGASVLQLPSGPDRSDDATTGRAAGVREALRAARETRAWPGRDDKVVASWNGLAIGALAETAALLDAPDLLANATETAELLARVHLVDGRLRRTSRAGRVGAPAGVLDDHGNLAAGLLTLWQVGGERRWLDLAGHLMDVALNRFGDGAGGFHDTADDAERLVRRPRDASDNATPSGVSALAGALVTYAAVTGSARHRAAAEAALGGSAFLLPRHVRFAGHACAVAEALLAGPVQVAVVRVVGDPLGEALERVARLGTAPGAVVAVAAPQASDLEFFVDRGAVEGRSAAYVCRGFVCERPTTDPAVLRAQVGTR